MRRLALAGAVPGAMMAVLLAGCGAGMRARMTAAPAARSAVACRMPVAPDGAASADAIAWTVPDEERERAMLDAWCGTTGPPVVMSEAAALPDRSSPAVDSSESAELVVVTWNLHEGAADLAELVSRLRSGALTGGQPAAHFVLLVQEAMRAGATVPRTQVPGVRPPRAIRVRPAGRERIDIVRMARSLGLSLYYVPSMRNGAAGETDEDRGNAILSTEPLSEFSAIELPFERQRRVAIGAAVSVAASAGSRWTMRVASVHLESTVPARRLWILATGARVRQARALLDALRPGGALVVGGDLNTWFGFSDPAYRTIAAAIPGIAAGDRRSTHAPFVRLDHLFAQLPDGATVTPGRRLDDRLGSDHYPILASVRLSSAASQ